MAKDAELDRLKTTQDQTFQRQQDAWQAQDQAWKHRSSAKDALERAYQNKQRAYDVQESSWQNFLRAKQDGPRIDTLNTQQEAAFQNMKTAFDNASAAYNSHNGVMASSYAAEGHRYKDEAQRHVAERRLIVDKIRAARARHEATKPAFQTAKAQFAQAKTAYNRAKEDHVRKQDEFKRAKAEFIKAKEAFHNRLELVQAESKKRNNDKRALAEKAGVPYQYRDNVYVSREPDGTVNIYFGGLGTPDGFGHGHYAIDNSGKVAYSRDPMEQHGAQNYTEPQYWHKARMSFDRDSGTFQTDNFIGIVGDKGQKTKAHIAVNSEGEIVFVRDVGDKVLYSRKDGIGNLPKDLDWSK